MQCFIKVIIVANLFLVKLTHWQLPRKYPPFLSEKDENFSLQSLFTCDIVVKKFAGIVHR